MFLKKHLCFIGKPKQKEISFHNIDSLDKDLIIEVDDFTKIWSYLNLLADSKNENLIEEWKKKNNIDKTEFDEMNQFLIENGMVYETCQYTKNIRAANFLNNYIRTQDNGDAIRKIEKETALIIGLGTVGTAVAVGLQQLGVCRFVFVDGDLVEQRNISHQRNYYQSDIGKPKVDILSERMRAIDSECLINTYQIRINSCSDLERIVNEKLPTVVFCCFDGHTSSLTKSILGYLRERNVPAYISGYMLSMIKAYELNEEVIHEELEFEHSLSEMITDNSGIGLLGDIAAFLMIRLWLQKIYIQFDMKCTSLEYDFLQPELSHKVLLENLTFLNGNTIDEYKRDNIVFPYILLKYVRFLQGDSAQIEEIENFSLENGVDFFEESEDVADKYLEFINSFTMEYEGKRVSLLEFSDIALHTNVKEEYFLKCIKQQENIIDMAITLLKRKKENYYAAYKENWENNSDLNAALLSLSGKIAKFMYKDTMDFLKYKPFSNEGYFLSERKEIALIKKMDLYNEYLDYSGFIDYCYEHNFLHVIEKGENSVTIMNPRYGTSDIIVAKDRNWQDIFNIAHEIGHGYYNSFLTKDVVTVDEITQETFSLMTEYRLIKMLCKEQLLSKFGQTIQNRIYSIAIGMYSLDLYEEGVMCLENISCENILKVRKEINKKIFGDIMLKNDQYSKYNMFMNVEMVTMKRRVYLYPEALLLGFDLGRRIEEDNRIEVNLKAFLKNAHEEKSIYRFYEMMGISNLNYNEMAENVYKLLLEIEKCA